MLSTRIVHTPGVRILTLLIAALLCTHSVPLHAQLHLDFEQPQQAHSFAYSTDSWWTWSDSAPLAGRYSLRNTSNTQHTYNNAMIVVRPTSNANQDTFRFVLRYSVNKGSISSATRFGVFVGTHLGAPQASIVTPSEAYYVGIKGTSGNDSLRLYWHQGAEDRTLLVSPHRIHNRTVAVEVVRTEQHMLCMRTGSAWDSLTHCGCVPAPAAFRGYSFGASTYSANTSYVKSLAIDNIYIVQASRTLHIDSLIFDGEYSLLVQLSKPIALAQVASKLQLIDPRNTVLELQQVQELEPGLYRIQVDTRVHTGVYTARLAEVLNPEGQYESTQISQQVYVPTFGDVVFTEIMPAYYPPPGLPEVRYVEVYNRTPHHIAMQGWSISHNTTTRVISGTLPANGYALLSPDTAAYPSPLQVSLPSLSSAGATLALRSPEGFLISQTPYAATWYPNDDVRQKGFALEKIDVDNLEDNALNWTASTHPQGGTPGYLNSVSALSPDTGSPALSYHTLTDSGLVLVFTEAIDPAKLRLANFACELGHPVNIQWQAGSPQQVLLQFASECVPQQVYRLEVLPHTVCDLAGNCAPALAITFGIGAHPQAGQLLINEVLATPHTGGARFVELYNPSDQLLNLEGVRIANRKVATGALDKAYALPYPYVLLPAAYVVLTTSAADIQEQYHCPNPDAMIELPTMPTYAETEGCVALLDSAGNSIEDFYYDKKMHSTMLTSTKGVSLERISPQSPASERSNWFSAAQSSGFGTPTGRNSQQQAPHADTHEGLSVAPEVFSPDGDGYHDVLLIDYNMEEGGYLCNMNVYDASGRPVRSLGRNMLLGTQGTLTWDGANDQGRLCPIGIYVVHAEVFSLGGKVRYYKSTCVLGAKL